jgi:hypothetical protein
MPSFVQISGTLLCGLVVAVFSLNGVLRKLVSACVGGRDIHGAFATGFATGAAAGLTLLVCSANEDYRAVVNAAWTGTSPVFADADIVRAVFSLMPGSAEALLRDLFAKASVPIFDSAALIVTLFLANCSLVMGLLSGATVDPLRRLFTGDRMPVLLKLLSGAFASAVFAATDSVANPD